MIRKKHTLVRPPSIGKQQQATVALFEAFLKRVAHEPWSLTTLEKSAQDLGYTPEWLPLLFPSGLESLVLLFQQRENQRMMKECKNFKKPSIRSSIIQGLLWRLEQEAQYGDASCRMRRYVVQHAALAWNISWDLAHTLWSIAEPDSDPSSSSFTTKRMLLCGLLPATHVVFFQKNRPSRQEMEKWLRRHINRLNESARIAKSFFPFLFLP